MSRSPRGFLHSRPPMHDADGMTGAAVDDSPWRGFGDGTDGEGGEECGYDGFEHLAHHRFNSLHAASVFGILKLTAECAGLTVFIS